MIRWLVLLLITGRVLMAGGTPPSAVATATAELYDPSTGTFSATASLITSREYHAGARLDNGTVLIVGGDGPGGPNATVMASAELY